MNITEREKLLNVVSLLPNGNLFNFTMNSGPSWPLGFSSRHNFYKAYFIFAGASPEH